MYFRTVHATMWVVLGHIAHAVRLVMFPLSGVGSTGERDFYFPLSPLNKSFCICSKNYFPNDTAFICKYDFPIFRY